MTQLHWVTVQPTPYNDFLFRSLATDPKIDLMVHFTESLLSSHPWQSRMAQGFCSRTYRRRFGLDWDLLRLAVGNKKAFFVIGGWRELTMISLIDLLILYRRPFAIWTDTPDQSRKRHSVKALLRQLWIRRIFNHASHVMGTGSPALSALKKMGCPKQKLVNFPYFVDLGFFVPGNGCNEYQETRFNTQIVFLSAGRLVNAHKGYDLAIRALAMARQRAGTNRFLYRIAGTGPDREVLELLAKQVGISNNVEFLGWLEPDDLPSFYHSGHLLLHPATFEPYGVTVLEAMASGLTVIGSDKTGAVLDRIVHMQNGMVHRTNDVNDFADKITYVLSHPETLGVMGIAARHTAESWPISRGIRIIRSMIERLQ